MECTIQPAEWIYARLYLINSVIFSTLPFKFCPDIFFHLICDCLYRLDFLKLVFVFVCFCLLLLLFFGLRTYVELLLNSNIYAWWKIISRYFSRNLFYFDMYVYIYIYYLFKSLGLKIHGNDLLLWQPWGYWKLWDPLSDLLQNGWKTTKMTYDGCRICRMSGFVHWHYGCGYEISWPSIYCRWWKMWNY